MGEILVEVFHAFACPAELGNAVDKEGNVFAEALFDVLEGELGVFDCVVEHACDDGIFVHMPLFEDLYDGKRVGDVGLASFA